MALQHIKAGHQFLTFFFVADALDKFAKLSKTKILFAVKAENLSVEGQTSLNKYETMVDLIFSHSLSTPISLKQSTVRTLK
jgi:hypothetical protein